MHEGMGIEEQKREEFYLTQEKMCDKFPVVKHIRDMLTLFT